MTSSCTMWFHTKLLKRWLLIINNKLLVRFFNVHYTKPDDAHFLKMFWSLACIPPWTLHMWLTSTNDIMLGPTQHFDQPRRGTSLNSWWFCWLLVLEDHYIWYCEACDRTAVKSITLLLCYGRIRKSESERFEKMKFTNIITKHFMHKACLLKN